MPSNVFSEEEHSVRPKETLRDRKQNNIKLKGLNKEIHEREIENIK